MWRGGVAKVIDIYLQKSKIRTSNFNCFVIVCLFVRPKAEVLDLYSLVYPLANFKSKIYPPNFFYFFTSANACNGSKGKKGFERRNFTSEM